jgi:hypothetical protein
MRMANSGRNIFFIYNLNQQSEFTRSKHVVILKILKSDECWEHYKVF